jgi:hypothetical protein
MKFEDSFFSREEHYSLGLETDSGRRYLSIPVSNGLVDYEEYYEVTESQYRSFLTDPASAAQFADSCRRHEHDDLLIQRPGSNRGTPV